MQSFCWSEAAVVGNLTKPGSGRSPSWCLPSGYFLRAFMDLAGKGQDDLGRICVRYTCYMTKQGTDRPLTLEILNWRQLERLRCGWSLTTWCRVFGVGSACGMLQVCATRRMSASTSRSHTVTPTLGVKKILLFPETWTKKFFFLQWCYKYTKLLLSYCTRFCLCCLLVTLYFDMFCYKKNDLDDDKQLELQ